MSKYICLSVCLSAYRAADELFLFLFLKNQLQSRDVSLAPGTPQSQLRSDC